MGWRQPLTILVEQEAGQQTWLLSTDTTCPLDAVLGQRRLDPIPEVLIDDRRMLSGIGGALVGDLAPVDPVLQHLAKGATAEDLIAIGSPIRPDTPFAPDPF